MRIHSHKNLPSQHKVHLAAIALGSNMGERAENLDYAVEQLKTLGRVVAVSSYIDTEPVGYTDQPRFLNAAALLETELYPQVLMKSLLEIERKRGRDRSKTVAKGPRTLDLDLLLYEDRIIHSKLLMLPHPEMHHRAFVLQPLAEIAPEWMHPVEHKTVRELLDSMGGNVTG